MGEADGEAGNAKDRVEQPFEPRKSPTYPNQSNDVVVLPKILTGSRVGRVDGDVRISTRIDFQCIEIATAL